MNRSIGNYRLVVGIIFTAVLAIAIGAIAAITTTGMGMSQGSGHTAVTLALSAGADGPPWG
jgi:hypothetical protein